jgi:hypothetical protein
MRQRPITRRAILGGLAGSALALPLLNVEQAKADNPVFPKRLIIVVNHQGTIYPNWLPRDVTGTTLGSEYDFHFPDTFTDPDPNPALNGTQTFHALTPLEPYKKDLIVLGGVNHASPYMDQYNAHYRAMCHLLTSTAMGPGLGFDAQGNPIAGWAGGPSVDQVIASRIGQSTQHLSLQFGVRTNSKSGGLKPFDGIQVMSYAGLNQPIPNESDPSVNFSKVFGNFSLNPSELALLRARRQSIVDGVHKNFAKMRYQLGSDDRVKLDNHWDRIREIERQIQIVTDPTANCTVPVLDLKRSDWRNYGPPGYSAFDDMPITVNANFDLITMALACDITRVATFHFDGDSFEWLNINPKDQWHDRTHLAWPDKPSKDWLLATYRWYAEAFGQLLGKLQSIKEGNGTLLDNTVVVWVNEMGDGSTHDHQNAPIVMAGGCGGALKTGRFLNFTQAQSISGPAWWSTNPIPFVGETTSNLWLSLLHAFDQQDASFGDPLFCSGGLPGLTG